MVLMETQKIELFRGYRRTLSADWERVLSPKSAVS